MSNRSLYSKVIGCTSSKVEDPLTARCFKQQLVPLCRSNDETAVTELVDAILKRLSASQDCGVRIKCLSVADYLFSRSQMFRRLLCARLQTVLHSVLDLDPVAHPIPRAGRKELLRKGNETLKSWYDRFGATQPKLANACNRLGLSTGAEVVSAADQVVTARSEARNERQRVLIETRVTEGLEENSAEIERCLLEIDACLSAAEIVENPLDCRPSTSSETAPPAMKRLKRSTDRHVSLISFREHGYSVKETESLQIDIASFESAEMAEPTDAAILETLKENMLLLSSKYAPLLAQWCAALARAGAIQQLQSRSIDLKHRISVAVERAERALAADDDEDNDFVDVPEVDARRIL